MSLKNYDMVQAGCDQPLPLMHACPWGEPPCLPCDSRIQHHASCFRNLSGEAHVVPVPIDSAAASHHQLGQGYMKCAKCGNCVSRDFG